MKVLLILIMTGLLVGCSPEKQIENATADANNENNISDENLINLDTVTENFWIQYNGQKSEDEQMMYTDKINYDSSKEYELNIDAYISYYKEDEFLETVLHIEDKSQTIENNEEADKIVVSLKKSFLDASLIQK